MKKMIISAAMVALLLMPAIVFAGRKCTGSENCTACTTCTGCKHCAKNGGTCGVCTPKSKKSNSSLTSKPKNKKKTNIKRAAPALPDIYKNSVAVPYTKPEEPELLYSVESKDKLSSEMIERLLCGAWKVSYRYESHNIDRKVTYYPDGTYTDKVTITAVPGGTAHDNGPASYKLEGEWRVENGGLKHRVESASGSDLFPAGHSYSMQIVEIDKKKAVFKNDDGTAFTGFRVY